MNMRRSLLASLFLAAVCCAARPAAADQITLSQTPATLSAGATAQLQISVQLGTVPFGGYLFTLSYDTRTLTLMSIVQPASGEFQDEFFRGPGDAQGSFSFQGLNDKSLLAPAGSAELAVAVFRATGSSVPFGASPSMISAVSVTAREAVTTEASSVTLPGASADYQILGDTVAPTTTLAVSTGPQFTDGAGQLYGATATLFGFTSADSAYGDFPPSGVISTEYRVDAATPSAAFSPFAAPFALAEGSHVVEFRSVDGAGNVEPTQSRTVKVDAAPPASAVAYSTTPYVDASSRTFISGSASVGFTAQDSVSGGVASGVDAIRFRVDAATPTAPFQVFVSTFVLAGGTHEIDFHAVDNVANEEAVRTNQVTVDTAPPVTVLFVNGLPESTTSLVLVSSDALSLSAIDGGAGVRQTLVALDGASETSFSSTFTLTAGTHTIVFRSLDNVDNAEAAQSFFATVRSSDSTPPVLSLVPVDGSTVAAASPLIAALYSDSGSGVDLTSVRLTLDGTDVTAQAAVTASSASFVPAFALTQGTHTATAQVADLSGNQSTATSTFLLDSIAPVTTLLVNGLPAGTTDLVVITTDTLGFAAADAGAGVFQTLYALDGSTSPVIFNSTFSLTGGTHTLAFHSVDGTGNAEAPTTVSVSVFGPDVTPPSLALTPGDGSTTTATTPSIAANYSDAERGMDLSTVRLSLDGVDVTTQAVVTASSATFVPSASLAQGTHTVTAQAADLAGNQASAASTFLVDSVPPVTTLLVNGLPAGSTTMVLISTDSFSFAATDGGSGVLETRYALDGSTTSLVFSSTFSLAGGTHTLSFYSQDRAGNLETIQTAALTVLGEDQTPPSLSLAPPDASTVTTASPQLIAAYSDDGRGVDTASVRLSLDGVDVTTFTFITASSASFAPSAALSQGTHTIAAAVADLAGNAASATSVFFIDSLPPSTILLVDGLAAGSTNLIITSTVALGFSVADAGTGVLETLYSVDGATETVFMSTFTLNPGGHTLAFHSRDRAGNLETAQTVSITITSPSSDTTPPFVRLDFPGTSGLGVEQAVGGIVNVRGAASDASALTWTLEAAPGISATTGFATIASGAGNISGLLAAWNTTSISGYQTLRLNATDAFGNMASVTASVFVGKPVFNFAIGRKDSHVIVNKIKNPTGIAIRADGLIWIAMTDSDELLLLTSSGAVVAEVDGDAGHGHHGNGHGHGDDDEEDNLGFKNPQGLALDSANNLYVSDRGNNRVVKLSPDGSQVLLQIAKLDNHGRPKPGSGPGELRRPWDAAVDSNGDIYVADSGNSRIQVFDSSGTFLRQFGPGVLLSTSEVRGIALTAEGLWVSDKEQERVFLFSRAGSLIKSIGDADSAVGEISRMRGLASDRLGALYVIEPNRDRTQKFDPQGKGLLAFGSKAGLSHADKHAKRYLTQPIDAAVAPDGSIWITDTGRDRIVRYALPSSSGYGVAAYSAGGDVSSSGSIEPAKRLVDARDGANVERDDGAGVRVPEGALAADLEITVDKGDENQDKEQKTAKRLEKRITAVSEEVSYGPEGTTFNAPVTLTLPYDANLIASLGIKEDDLKVYYWNTALQDWQAMPSVVDKVNKTVNAETNHFSNYQVGGLGGIGVAAIDDFGFRDGYAFPSPSRGGAAVTFRMQPGSADSIEVRVYDVSGRKLHSSSDFRFRGALDDGNGKGAQNTYDHVWDVSGVGSGVYTFVMTAKKSGEKDIRKTGKVGVIK